MLIFLHIPKTAGTSINDVLSQKYSVYPFGRIHEIDAQELKEIKKYECISGHISFDQLSDIDSPKIFTFLRDPIDRCLSWYYFTNQGEMFMGQRLEINEFFRSDNPHILQNIENRMAWQIGANANINHRDLSEKDLLKKAKENISNFYFVGTYENLQEDYNKLTNLLGLDHKLPRKRITSNRKSRNDISVETIDLIMERNTLDQELYDFVRDLN